MNRLEKIVKQLISTKLEIRVHLHQQHTVFPWQVPKLFCALITYI